MRHFLIEFGCNLKKCVENYPFFLNPVMLNAFFLNGSSEQRLLLIRQRTYALETVDMKARTQKIRASLWLFFRCAVTRREHGRRAVDVWLPL